ncbi:MAG: hypothetical protein AMXMBFR33_40210 [Candidatus Xenobia bacterium]
MHTDTQHTVRPAQSLLILLAATLTALHLWQTRAVDDELRRQAQLAMLSAQVSSQPEAERSIQSTEEIARQAEGIRQRVSRWARLEGILLAALTLLLCLQAIRRRGPNPEVLERQLDQLEDAGRDLLRRFHEVDRSHRKLKADLSAAGRMQRALLPQHPPRLPAVEVGWMFTACSHVAGDMFNVFALDERRLGVWVLDVSGHGVPAALLSVTVSRVLHPNPRQGGLLRRPKLGAPGGSELVSPAQVARELNRRYPQSHVAGLYFTLVYGILDTVSGTFTYVRCGHPPPLLATSGQVRAIDSEGCLPLGILDSSEFHDEVVQLSPGDRLILYTDGVTECSGPDGEFGEERLQAILAGRRGRGAVALMETLKAELARHSSGRPRDDQTAVCLIWRPRHG